MRRCLIVLTSVLVAAGVARADDNLAPRDFRPTGLVTPLPGGHFLCDVSFPHGGVAVGYDGSVELDRAADAMQTDRDALVVLDAYTDGTGPERTNTALARARAEAVMDGLVARGVDPDRIVIAVFGDRAVRRGAGALNRRVDLWMTYTVSIQEIVDRTLVTGDVVLWSPRSAGEVARKPRLTATRERGERGGVRLTASR